MKLLFDQNLSFRIVKRVEDLFPDCSHITSVGLVNARDFEIWRYAQKHGYSIVTFDVDFYDISMIKGCPPKIIWLNTGNLSTLDLAITLRNHYLKIRHFLTSNDEEQSCLVIENITP